MSAQMKAFDAKAEKKELAEITFGDIGINQPDSFNYYISSTEKLNVPLHDHENKTVFDLAISTGSYEFAQAILNTRFRLDKRGIDINLIDAGGFSPCKTLIARISTESNVAKLPEAYTLLQDLIDADMKLTSDEETTLPSGAWRNATSIKSQTPLDFAIKCTPAPLKLDFNYTWRGFPDKPPEVFLPVRMLLKTIYHKNEKEMEIYKDKAKLTISSPLACFSYSLRNLILDYAAEPIDFTVIQFRYRDQLLHLGKLFYEYDLAIDRQNNPQLVESDKITTPDISTSEIVPLKNNNKPVNTEIGEIFKKRLINVEREQILIRQEFAQLGETIIDELKEQSAQIQKLMSMFETFSQSSKNNNATSQNQTTGKGFFASLFSFN